MKATDYAKEKIVRKISPIYEKVFTPTGNGFTGFTIYYSEDSFANHIQFFEKENHKQIVEQVQAIHTCYCAACQSVKDDNKLIKDKEKYL